MSASLPAYAEKYALLIGLNEYASVRSGIVELKYAINDVQALEGRLKQMGYSKIRRFENAQASRGTIVRELNRYAEIVQPADTFLIYFAGHGVRRKPGDTVSFWLTYHSQLDWLDDEGIRLSHLMEYLRDIRARQKIVLLDHCYSGHVVDVAGAAGPVDVSSAATAGGGGSASPESRAPGTRNLGLAEARGQGSVDEVHDQVRAVAGGQGLLMVAAAHDEAYESPTVQHGYFTQALLKAFSTREASGVDARLTANELVPYLRTQVTALSGGKQQVREFAAGADLSNWLLIEGLPEQVADIDAARTKRERFRERLSSWENQRFLDFNARMRCERALTAWIKSLEPGGAPLSNEHERILRQVENHMNDTFSAEENADDLERELERIPPEPPQ